MNNAGDPKRRYPDRSGNDTSCRWDQGKADDFFLRGQGSWRSYKPADQQRTCIGLQRGAAADKQRHRDRFHGRAEGRRIERSPKIYEKRPNNNTRPGTVAEQKEAAEGKTGRWPDCRRVPGWNCQKER